MNERNKVDPTLLPFQVEDVLGEILVSTQPYPGVYYIATERNETDLLAAEYYLVFSNADTISATVKKYGQFLPYHDGLLVYAMDDDRSGWRLVEYEGLKYLTQNGLPLPEGRSLRDAAVFGAEYHPEYFGEYPAPLYTPWGTLLRYKVLDNGIFWLETDLCEQLLAVCYPVWSTELSDTVAALGKQNKQEVGQPFEYLFFQERNSCVPLFELLQTRSEWKDAAWLDVAALMNAVWERFPEYAALYNINEQAGTHNVIRSLLSEFGVEWNQSVGDPAKWMVSVSPKIEKSFVIW